MQSETRIDTHVKINTSIAGNVTKYNNLHTQESFDKKILTLPNFAFKKFWCGEPKWHLLDWNNDTANPKNRRRSTLTRNGESYNEIGSVEYSAHVAYADVS